MPRLCAPPALVGALALWAGACSEGQGPPTPAPAVRSSILLVTLDTTRADAIGEATPAFNALAARGRRFTRAYAAVPETLPSHTSMMSGLYPAGHGVHENARPVGADTPLLAEKLRQAGYETGAFLSSFVLAKRFGLARGFDVYDDIESPERSSRETTDRALEFLGAKSLRPRFVWVHYFDAHAPYAPPEPFRSRFSKNPYLGEVAAADEQLGRLLAGFEQSAPGPVAIVVAGDHGEGLGDHGEAQHGNLVYESTMHVPLALVGPGVPPGDVTGPVSLRRIFPTVLDLAGLGRGDGLSTKAPNEVVLGEAMKPFLEYGWQPQVMAVDASHKAIVAGRTEVYDLTSDPKETRDLSATLTLARETRNALMDYPLPSPGKARASSSLSEEDRKKLASLGYVSAGAAPVVRKDAPRPADMARLFGVIEEASTLFVREEYARSIPLFERILREDAGNLDAALRLATAHSALGHEEAATRMFDRARSMAPQSEDVKVYLALHLARGPKWAEAVPALERIVADSPDRLPAVEALARVRERQGRFKEAIATWQNVHALRAPRAAELIRVGELAMEVDDTDLAIRSFEAARALNGRGFGHDLELGVLYLSARRFEEARAALDRVPASHPARAMALFKRAQVSVLLKEPDQGAWIEAARRAADPTTRELIARERLFQPDRR